MTPAAAPVRSDPAQPNPARLRRALSLPLLILYGLGTTVGAGIYALTGKIAGLAGVWAPLSFALACVLASFTALSFGELASRYPKSAGEAAYLRAGFSWPRLAQAGGFSVCLAGATSSATLSLAAVGYLTDLFPIEPRAALFALVLVLALIAAWGIGESVTVTALLTLIEVGGVVLVTAFGVAWLSTETPRPSLASEASTFQTVGILSGAVLGFYAFLGFEDMVNVAEEVKRPRRNLPLGITITLIATGILYLALSSVAVLAVSPTDLAESDAPVTLVYSSVGGVYPGVISAVAALGMLNGILVQIIMGSRVLYGLAAQDHAPQFLSVVHPRTRTPLYATATVVLLVFLLVGFFPLEDLARVTSWITLVLFAFVNWALLRVKNAPGATESTVDIPRWIPRTGALLCAALVLRDWIGALT